MKPFRFVLTTLFLFSGMYCSYGQGTMVYLNGKLKRFASAEVKGDFIVFKKEGDQTEGVKKIEKFDVFSINFDNGTEQIIYEPDTAYGDPTVNQVRDYISGEQFADSIYRKPLNMITGIAAGAGGALWSVFYGPIVPVVYATTISFFTPHIPDKELEKTVRSEDFIAGYEKKARNKKTKNALLGGAIGFGLTTAVLLIVN